MAAKKPGTAVVSWESELEKAAQLAAKMEENVGGGQFFTTKSGVLAWQDAPMPNNEMAVVILDSILENVYYDKEFDPDTPQAPLCFAYGRDEKEMGPHKIVVEANQAQADQCHGCKWNDFGTAMRGKGKACRNTRRLAMIPAGQLDQQSRFKQFTDEKHFDQATAGYMKLPVTSVKGYAGFVKQVAGALKRPPFGIFTKVKVIPDAKNQFTVLFEPIANVPDNLMPTIMKRVQEVQAVIDFPYPLGDDDDAKKTAGKKPTKRAARKY